jgi:hypothetical protein
MCWPTSCSLPFVLKPHLHAAMLAQVAVCDHYDTAEVSNGLLRPVHCTLKMKEPLYTQNIATLLQHMLRIHLHNPGTYLRAVVAGAGQCIAT